MSTIIIIDVNTDEVKLVQGWSKPYPKYIYVDAHVERTGDDPNDIDILYLEEDMGWGDWAEQYYITGGANTLRPPMGIIVSATDILIGETATISNIPEGTEVYLDDVLAGTIDATGEMSISSNVLRHFHLKFVKHPYLDEEVTIRVT